jgi:uncharacterized protein
MTQIMTLYNANVYINGNNTAGKAEEVTLPDLRPKMTDHKPLSGVGTFQLPTGLDAMSMKIKWNSADDALMGHSADFYNSNDIMVRGNADIWQNGSRIASAPVTAIIRGLSKNVPAINFKHQDNPDIETEYSVTGYELFYNGVEVFAVDLFAQVYRVEGVDMLADYRANLGL